MHLAVGVELDDPHERASLLVAGHQHGTGLKASWVSGVADRRPPAAGVVLLVQVGDQVDSGVHDVIVGSTQPVAGPRCRCGFRVGSNHGRPDRRADRGDRRRRLR